MRAQLDKELKALHVHFTKMGTLATEALVKSIQAFVEHDRDLAQIVIDEDYKINKKEIELETKCAKVIALQQPVVSDLRKIVSVMKACSDLERMGDHARSIAQTTIQEKGNKRIPGVESQIADMSRIVIEMAKRMLVAYVDGNTQEAREIAELDALVDDYFTKINQFSIAEMKADPKVVYNGSGYISVATHLERIADYITNVCERIIYIETGELEELN